MVKQSVAEKIKSDPQYKVAIDVMQGAAIVWIAYGAALYVAGHPSIILNNSIGGWTPALAVIVFLFDLYKCWRVRRKYLHAK